MYNIDNELGATITAY